MLPQKQFKVHFSVAHSNRRLRKKQKYLRLILLGYHFSLPIDFFLKINILHFAVFIAISIVTLLISHLFTAEWKWNHKENANVIPSTCSCFIPQKRKKNPTGFLEVLNCLLMLRTCIFPTFALQISVVVCHQPASQMFCRLWELI